MPNKPLYTATQLSESFYKQTGRHYHPTLFGQVAKRLGAHHVIAQEIVPGSVFKKQRGDYAAPEQPQLF